MFPLLEAIRDWNRPPKGVGGGKGVGKGVWRKWGCIMGESMREPLSGGYR